MAGFVAAKLCPELIFVRNVHSRYSEMSKRVMDIFRYYDPNMAVAGCDEGYLKYVSTGTLLRVANVKTALHPTAKNMLLVRMS